MRVPRLVAFRVALFLPLLAVLVLVITGLWVRLFERDFYSDFTYPLHVDNLEGLVYELRSGRWPPTVTPIHAPDVPLLLANGDRCPAGQAIHLLLVIKSAVQNEAHRAALRATWTAEDHQPRGLRTKHVFLLGRHQRSLLDARVREEQDLHGDMVQGDFIDTYGNVTIKTLMGLGWALHRCPGAGHVLFVDDDYLVSVVNLVRSLERHGVSLMAPPGRRHLLLGRVFHATPIRFYWDKWYISLTEYPYHRFPPFINAGAYLVSSWTLQALYFASYFTAPLRFDDVYLGILAHKMRIRLTDDHGFFNNRLPYDTAAYAGYVAVHGFAPSEVMDLWNEQRRLGNA